MATRGRPRKEPQESKKEWEIIASVLAQVCSIPGCVPKHHNMDAALIAQALSEEGYSIKKNGSGI